ncbi:hypothetical protein HK096_008510 [Nowakowskiella sp. JEL0078]|nr:hypothetical protein HK096_008510 [Nowakowskiella sp. JEL0078]
MVSSQSSRQAEDIDHPFAELRKKKQKFAMPAEEPVSNSRSYKVPNFKNISEISKSMSSDSKKKLAFGFLVFSLVGMGVTNYIEQKYPPMHKRTPEELEKIGVDPSISRVAKRDETGKLVVREGAPKSHLDVIFDNDIELKALLYHPTNQSDDTNIIKRSLRSDLPENKAENFWLSWGLKGKEQVNTSSK